MIYLISGENTPLIDDAIDALKTRYSEVVFDVLPAAETTLAGLTGRLHAIDLFSSANGWLVRNPKWLKTASKQDLRDIPDFLTATEISGPIILVVTSIDKRTAVYKALKKHGITHTHYDVFKDWESDKVMAWVTQYTAKKKWKVSSDVIEQLTMAYANNVGLIIAELKKLSVTVLPKNDISMPDLVHSSSNALGHYRQLSEALAQGSVDGILQSLYHLVQLKEDPHAVFNRLLFQFNQLILMHQGVLEGVSHDALAKSLGKHPFFIKKQMASVRANRLAPTFSAMIQTMAVLDQQLKQGRVSGTHALIRIANQLKHQ
jgi:DNA polymerase III delta subunit